MAFLVLPLSSYSSSYLNSWRTGRFLVIQFPRSTFARPPLETSMHCCKRSHRQRKTFNRTCSYRFSQFGVILLRESVQFSPSLSRIRWLMWWKGLFSLHDNGTSCGHGKSGIQPNHSNASYSRRIFIAMLHLYGTKDTNAGSLRMFTLPFSVF